MDRGIPVIVYIKEITIVERFWCKESSKNWKKESSLHLERTQSLEVSHSQWESSGPSSTGTIFWRFFSVNEGGSTSVWVGKHTHTEIKITASYSTIIENVYKPTHIGNTSVNVRNNTILYNIINWFEQGAICVKRARGEVVLLYSPIFSATLPLLALASAVRWVIHHNNSPTFWITYV